MEPEPFPRLTVISASSSPRVKTIKQDKDICDHLAATAKYTTQFKPAMHSSKTDSEPILFSEGNVIKDFKSAICNYKKQLQLQLQKASHFPLSFELVSIPI